MNKHSNPKTRRISRKSKKKESPTVLDVYCGAGGFSEGFRQQGFEVVLGIDNWRPAINTFNHNFKLKCEPRNVLDFYDSDQSVEELPDTTVIIGSPPCVSFSNSNQSGKADKSLGIKLIKAFLRIVAVKKHKPNSCLKAWYMENVTNSSKFIKAKYSFRQLRLTKWSVKHGYHPDDIALSLSDNYTVVNSADYGCPQIRKRVVFGEFVGTSKCEMPKVTHDRDGINLAKHVTLGFVRSSFPSPFDFGSVKYIQDPLYPEIRLKSVDFTDHFYDTGLYSCVWNQSKYLKRNHPFMGRMSFPENVDKPSRTITALTIATSRESIIYRSEFKRKGNGEYRTPTIRESATLMGFPISYQFIATKGSKAKLVGNAVCPTVSCAIAKNVRQLIGLSLLRSKRISKTPDIRQEYNLNDFRLTKFDNPPKRNRNSRFRRHPFKYGNMTVTLSNYNLTGSKKVDGRWRTSIQYGNGAGYPTYKVKDGTYKELEKYIRKFSKGTAFLEIVNNGFTEQIGNGKTLQLLYEEKRSQDHLLEPTEIVDKIALIIENLRVGDEMYPQDHKRFFRNRKEVPFKQLLALHAINKVSTIANR